MEPFVKSAFHNVKRADGPPRYRIKVLEKALAVLDLLGEASGEYTLTEIADRLGMSKPTAFRIVTVLEEAGYLEKGAKGYRLGLKLHWLSSRIVGTTALQKIARPFLEELKEQCSETVHLTVLDKGAALYLDKIEGQHTIRVVTRVGMRLPAHCSGVGKVLLANLPDEDVDRILRERSLTRFTPNTITDRGALRVELERIRERGYALDNEEIERGLKCVAAPIREASGRVVAAVSISGPKFRFDEDETASLVSLVRRAAERISAAMPDEVTPTNERTPRDATIDRPVGKRRATSRR